MPSCFRVVIRDDHHEHDRADAYGQGHKPCCSLAAYLVVLKRYAFLTGLERPSGPPSRSDCQVQPRQERIAPVGVTPGFTRCRFTFRGALRPGVR